MPNHLEETAAHVALQRLTANRPTDLCAISPSERWWPNEDEELDEVANSVRHHWNPDARPSDLVVEVLSQFLRLAPAFNLINVTHEPNTAEFHWSWVRCLIAVAGHEAHATLAAIATDLYPMCPLAADETRAAWGTALSEAHAVCGWPVTLAFMPFAKAYYACEPIDQDDDVPLWCTVLALLHTLKHVRVDAGNIVVCHKGQGVYWPLPKGSNSLTAAPAVLTALIAALGHRVPRSSKEAVRPLGLALSRTTKRMTTASILSRRSLVDLPPQVFAGPWSSLTPCPQDSGGFTQTAMRLDGVWLAHDGSVIRFDGDDSDALVWAWGLDNTAPHAEARRRFSAVMPAHYSVGRWPSETFRSVFPNVNLEWLVNPADKDAYCALLDSVICCGLMRRQVPALAHEFPFVLLQPQTPMPGMDTNQGKTLAAHTLARVVSPAIGVTVANDNGSAPDTRDLATAVSMHGTLCLDEWAMPKAQTAFLCHRNIQSILTGGTISVGRILENSGGVMLRHSLFASCKFADFPADMLTRTLPIYLDPLSREARADGDTEWAIKSGASSVDMRLSALGLVDQHGLVDTANAARQGSNAWRYPVHVAVAAAILKARTGLSDEACATLIEGACTAVKARLLVHAKDAETSGLAMRVREGITIDIRPEAVFNELEEASMMALIQHAESTGRTIEDERCVTPGGILRGRFVVAGGRPDQPLCRLLPSVTGLDAKVSDRTLIMSFGENLLVSCAATGFWRVPGTEWMLAPRLANDRQYFTFIRALPLTQHGDTP